MKVVYDDEAFNEAMEAAKWYEIQQEELAKRFLIKWKEAENRMMADPKINRRFENDLRKCRFEIFPHTLVYRISDPNTLQVVAVMHPSRRPDYWKDRAAD